MALVATLSVINRPILLLCTLLAQLTNVEFPLPDIREGLMRVIAMLAFSANFAVAVTNSLPANCEYGWSTNYAS